MPQTLQTALTPKTPSLRRSRLPALTAFGLCAAAIITPVLAQQQERLSRDCRQEIVSLCGTDRSQIRSCLQESAAELSQGCASELQERASQRRRGQARDGDRQGRRGDRGERGVRRASAVSIPISRTVIYGNHSRQQIDVYEPADAVDPLPIVVFVHGGGWTMGDRASVQAKPAHFNKNGYYFASIGYRVLPDAPVEEQAADIGTAIRALRGQAASIGFDPDRIVLMGHSAGAHLAALVAAEPSYTGDAFDAVRGVVLLDGAGYDVAANMAAAKPFAGRLYNNAFGDDPARHAQLSPITYVGGRDAPNWLALYVAERENSRDQSQMLANALVEAGADASALPIEQTDHGRMNRELGTEAGAAQTELVDAFLVSLF